MSLTPLAPADLASVQERIAAHLTWSPHDFVRRPGFREVDRRHLAEQVTRPLPASDDLRFLTDDGRTALLAERLPWDSDFFGWPVVRLQGLFQLGPYDASLDLRPAVRAWVEAAAARGARYVFAAVPAEDIAGLRALTGEGFELIESRLTHHVDLRSFVPPERHAARAARPEDVPSLARTAVEMVNPYDRFHADPLLPRAQVDRLMAEWVRASVCDGFADVTLCPDVPGPRAFVTLKYHRRLWGPLGVKLGQPIFGAVHHELRGWYERLIVECAMNLREVAGAEHMFLVSQPTNRQVLHVWHKLGFEYGRSEHVLRRLLG